MQRRRFLTMAAAAPASAQSPPRPPVAVFSKPLQKLSWTELGRAIRGAGLRHADLTVRKGGHVDPARVASDLPQAAKALAAEGVEIVMITTEIVSTDASARAVLAAASRLKIPFYKPGYWRYRGEGVEQALARVRRDAEGLVSMGRDLNIEAVWHNHSGDYVGHNLWDAREVMRDLDPRWIGYYFDTSHAFAEGGVGGWRIALQMALPRLRAVAVKDHVWTRADGRWTKQNVPLGNGMVNFPDVVALLARGGFHGPVSLHVEYETPDPAAAVAADAAFLRRQLDRHWQPEG